MMSEKRYTVTIEAQAGNVLDTFEANRGMLVMLALGQVGATFDTIKEARGNIEYIDRTGEENWTGGSVVYRIREVSRQEEIIERLRQGFACDVPCKDCPFDDTEADSISCEKQMLGEFNELLELIKEGGIKYE